MKRKRIAIFVDHKIRDLAGSVYLKIILSERYHYNVLVASIDASNIITLFRPHIILMPQPNTHFPIVQTEIPADRHDINQPLVQPTLDIDPHREDVEVIKVPANEIAQELGNERTMNMIMLGAFVAKTGITTPDSLMNGLGEVLNVKKASILELNRKGMERGAEYVL